jgi:hypothetical protein
VGRHLRLRIAEGRRALRGRRLGQRTTPALSLASREAWRDSVTKARAAVGVGAPRRRAPSMGTRAGRDQVPPGSRAAARPPQLPRGSTSCARAATPTPSLPADIGRLRLGAHLEVPVGGPMMKRNMVTIVLGLGPRFAITPRLQDNGRRERVR